MSVLDGYNKYKRYIKTNDGYKLCSQWTSSNTVQMDDGNTLQTNLGAINGITDSLTATSSNIAASAAAVKTLNDSLTLRMPASQDYNTFSDEYFYGYKGDTPLYYRYYKSQIIDDTEIHTIQIPSYMKAITEIHVVFKSYSDGIGLGDYSISFWIYSATINIQNKEVIGSNNYGVCKIVYSKNI